MDYTCRCGEDATTLDRYNVESCARCAAMSYEYTLVRCADDASDHVEVSRLRKSGWRIEVVNSSAAPRDAREPGVYISSCDQHGRARWQFLGKADAASLETLLLD